MANPTSYLIDPLTDREMDVLSAIADGMSNQQIANHLQLALATVKWYAGQIYSKLDVGNRQDAVERAHQLGLFDDDTLETTTTPHNLPQMTTPFIGRRRELADLQARLTQDDSRLITIMAQGGMGKTRLAHTLAEQNLARFTDGVYLVQLAPISDDGDSATSVVTAIANVLGLQHYDDRIAMQDNLLHYLQTQTMLLILDNFEHLLSAGIFISQILATAPQVKIIVTSRERLKLRGEVVYPLYGMTQTDHAEDEAMTLFIQSTQRIRPDYTLTDEDNPHIANICRLVEGLPLGIELAAGWMDTLSPEAIAKELQTSLDILETDLLDVPDRHRSIQATFAYTWDTLTESERQTMMTLSLFKGGITQDTAYTIAMADIRRLRLLVNKSLLHHHPQTDRFTIHELLRQYCFDQLLASGNYDDIIAVYMTYFADYADALYHPMDSFDGEAFDAIRADWENIAFAWWKMLAYKRYDLLEKTYLSLWLFSSMQGHSYECATLFKAVIDHIESLNNPTPTLQKLLAHLLMKYGDLLFGIETPQHALATLQRGIDIAEQLNEKTLQLLYAYDLRLSSSGKYATLERADDYAEALITLAEEMEQHAYIINAYSILWERDEFVSDEEAYTQSLDHAYDIWKTYCLPINDHPEVLRHIHFTRLLSRLDRQEELIQLLEMKLAFYEQAHWLYGLSRVRSQLMIFVFRDGDLKAYAEHALAVLTWHKQHGRDWQLVGCISGISGRAMYYTQNYTLAATMGYFVAHHPLAVAMQKTEAQCLVDDARPYLTQEDFQKAVEQASTMTLQEAYQDSVRYWSDYIASHIMS
ncbi:MAG: LuxR C-terminal-related transcriptional regulator [Chloroflexota bacterium]